MSRLSKKKKANSKKKRVIWVLSIVTAIIILTVVIGVVYTNKILDHLDYEETDNAEWNIDAQVAESLSDYRHVAILGVDARTMSNFDGSRSDAIIILSINKKTGGINLISVMRDTYLQLNNSGEELILDKITNAHAFGGGVNTCRALNRNLDLNIREYAIFNWMAVANTVDSLGGIQVEVKQNELADLNTIGMQTGSILEKEYTTISQEGIQTLDGVQAASYCRIRKTSGGDSQRAERMKKVLAAIFTEAKQMSVFDLNEVASEVLPNIRTNVGNADLVGIFAGVGKYELNENIALPYEYDGGMFHGGWYAVPRTLESNVIQLHKEAFGLPEYVVSDTVLTINNMIIEDTGVVPK